MIVLTHQSWSRCPLWLFPGGYVAIGSVRRQPNLDISRQPKYQSASHILPAPDCLLRKPGGWRWEVFSLRTSSIWHAPRISITVFIKSIDAYLLNSCVSSNLHADKNAVTHGTMFCELYNYDLWYHKNRTFVCPTCWHIHCLLKTSAEVIQLHSHMHKMICIPNETFAYPPKFT